MTQPQVSLTVRQRELLAPTPYVVEQVVNATDWNIGKMLSKADLDAIISTGVKVTIKA